VGGKVNYTYLPNSLVDILQSKQIIKGQIYALKYRKALPFLGVWTDAACLMYLDPRGPRLPSMSKFPDNQCDVENTILSTPGVPRGQVNWICLPNFVLRSYLFGFDCPIANWQFIREDRCSPEILSQFP